MKILKSTSNKNIEIIILLSILFNSCSLIYEICDYCNLEYNGIENIVLTDDYNYSYHKKCVELYRKPKKNSISSKKIIIESDISGIIEEVRNKLSSIGMKFKIDDKNHFIDDLLKNNVISNNYKVIKAMPGFHLFDKNITITIVNYDNEILYNHNCKYVRGKAQGLASGNNVFIEEGLSELRFKGVLAHELTHVWQWQNKMSIGANPKFTEGLAELVQAHIYKMDTTYVGKHMYKSQINQPNRIYREGYREMKHYLELYGWKQLFDFFLYQQQLKEEYYKNFINQG